MWIERVVLVEKFIVKRQLLQEKIYQFVRKKVIIQFHVQCHLYGRLHETDKMLLILELGILNSETGNEFLNPFPIYFLLMEEKLPPLYVHLQLRHYLHFLINYPFCIHFGIHELLERLYHLFRFIFLLLYEESCLYFYFIQLILFQQKIVFVIQNLYAVSIKGEHCSQKVILLLLPLFPILYELLRKHAFQVIYLLLLLNWLVLQCEHENHSLPGSQIDRK